MGILWKNCFYQVLAVLAAEHINTQTYFVLYVQTFILLYFMSKSQVGVWPCHSQGGNQYWLLSKKGELRRDDACLDFGGKDVSRR